MGLHVGKAASPATALLLLLAAVSSVGRRQTVEEVTKKQLEVYVAEEDYLAVYWCKSNLPSLLLSKWDHGGQGIQTRCWKWDSGT